MDNKNANSSKVEKLITEVIKLEKNFMNKKSMLEREKVNEIKKLIEKEVKLDAD